MVKSYDYSSTSDVTPKNMVKTGWCQTTAKKQESTNSVYI